MNSFKLLPKQEEAIWFLRQQHINEMLYGGAAGGGKTALGCLWLNEQAITFKGSRWMMGRAKLKTLKQTTLTTFFELASELNYSNTFEYNQQAGEIRYKNGSVIILKDLFLYPSDPEFDALGSLEVCGGFVDEIAQITAKAWQISLSRCRFGLSKFNITPKLLGSCNPTKNFAYKQFYKPSKDKSLKSNRAFVQAFPTDNPHLPQSYLDALLSLDNNSRERLYYGNWEYDDDPSALMQYENIVQLFSTQPQLGGSRYISADVARLGKDKTTIMVWDALSLIDFKEYPKTLVTETSQIIKGLAKQYNIPLKHVVVDEDGVGGGVVDILNCVGFVNNSKPIKGEDKSDNYQNLRSQCYFKLGEMVNQNMLSLCKFEAHIADLVAEELEQIKRKDIDKDGKLAIVPKDDIKKNIGRSPDYADCLNMRMIFEVGYVKPIRKMRAL